MIERDHDRLVEDPGAEWSIQGIYGPPGATFSGEAPSLIHQGQG